MIAGALEIQLLAGIARLQTDMNQAKSVVGSAMSSIERSVGMAKNALGLLGIGLGAGYFVHLLKGAAEAQAKMADLAEEVGTTAAAISRFEEPARKAGLSLDDVAKSMFKMTKAIEESRDPQSKSAQALLGIGLAAKDFKNLKPDEIFELITRRTAEYSDGLKKNAVQMEIFGKGGREMNKLAKEISETIKLKSTVTNEDAAAAKLLGDQTVELQMNSEKFWRSIASTAIPAINQVTKAYIDNAKEFGVFAGIFASVESIWDRMKGTAEEQLKDVNDKIAFANKLRAEGGDSAFAYNDLLEKRDALEAKIFARELDAQNKRALSGMGQTGKPEITFDPAATEAARKGLQAYDNEVVNLTTELAKLNGMGELEAYQMKLQSESFKNLTSEQKINLGILKEMEIEKKQLIETTKEEIKSAVDLVKAQDEITNGTEEYLQALRDSEEQMAFDNALIGKSAEEIAKLTEMRRRDLELLKAVKALGPNASSADVQLLIDANKAAKERVGILMDTGAALKNEVSILDSLSTAFGNFILSFQNGWKGAMDFARNLLKQLLSEMIAFFAKKWFLNVVASGTAGTLSTAANAAGSAMGGSVLGAGLSAASSAVGLTGFASNVAAGFSAGSYGVGAVGGGTVGGSIGSALGTAWEGFVALGPVGWISAAAAIAYAVFAQKAGGAKSGGSFQGQFDATGALIGQDNTPLFGLKPGEATDSASVQTIAAAATASYYALVTKLGGNARALNFGLGYDTDPQGTANNRVMATLTDATGKLLFSERDREIGRDSKNIGPELQLTASRALLAALQSSDLQKDIADLLKSVDATSATQDQLNTIFQQAAELKGILDGLAATGIKSFDLAALKAMAIDGETIAQTYQRVGASYAGYVDAFTSDSEKFTRSLEALRTQFSDLGIAMPTSNAAFRQLVEAQDLSTEAGRKMFAALIQIAPAFASVSNSVASMIGNIQSSITSIYGGQFGAMFAKGALDAAVRALNAFVGLPASYDAQTINDLISGVNTQYIIDLINNPTTDPALIALLSTLLTAFGTWQGALNANTTATNTNTPVVVDNTAAIAAARDQAKTNLAGYLQASLLSNLSPLTPMQQLTEARRQYESNLTSAQGGNVDAINNFGASRDAYLQIARQIYASSGAYNDIFNSTLMQGNALAGTNFTPYGLQDAVAQTTRIVESVNQVTYMVDQLIQRLSEPLPVEDEAVAANLEATRVQLATSGNGALTSGSAVLP